MTPIMHTPRTLYLIADGGRARYVECTGPGRFTTIRKFESPHIHEKSSSLGHNKPARVQESAAPARHGIEARIDARDKVEADFVRSIADDLGRDAAVKDYDKLVVITPAKLQSVLVKQLPSAIAAKLAKCINKDLTKIPDAELHRHLPILLR